MMGQFIGAQGIQRGGSGRPTLTVRGPLAPLGGRMGGKFGAEWRGNVQFRPELGAYMGAFGAGTTLN